MGGAATLRDDEPMSEMNTTPLIDVMLVLLIMFIITIPIQTHSVPLDLPQGGPRPTTNLDRNQLAIAADGQVLWNGTAVNVPMLRGLLAGTAALPRQPELQLLPDPEARYERVDEVLALVRRSNITAMGFVGNERYRDF